MKKRTKKLLLQPRLLRVSCTIRVGRYRAKYDFSYNNRVGFGIGDVDPVRIAHCQATDSGSSIGGLVGSRSERLYN